MDSSTVVLGLRVVLSLAVVLGLVWWLSRRNAGTRVKAPTMSVVGRQSLGRHAGVAVVEVEGRRLLLGVTDQRVALLTELDVPLPARQGVERREIDADELARLVDLDGEFASDLDDMVDGPVVTTTASAAPVAEVPAAPDPAPQTMPAPARTARSARTSHRPAARMPAVPTPRNPLEGSLLDASMWRQAVVAVQERTIRR